MSNSGLNANLRFYSFYKVYCNPKSSFLKSATAHTQTRWDGF